MRRKTFAHMNCSIARALEQIGEWWTFLIVREALMGTRRFDRFQSNLGIARNILAARLKKLVARGILERVVAPDDGRRIEYRMTAKGRALFPVLMALREWGDRWVVGANRVPVIVVDRGARRADRSARHQPRRPSDRMARRKDDSWTRRTSRAQNAPDAHSQAGGIANSGRSRSRFRGHCDNRRGAVTMRVY